MKPEKKSQEISWSLREAEWWQSLVGLVAVLYFYESLTESGNLVDLR